MHNELLSDLAKIAEFEQLTERFKNVEGWVSPLEGYLLYRLAHDGEGPGAIVEIGSWMGRSTVWLAAGSKAAGRERVHAIDEFNGGPILKTNPVIVQEGTTYHRYTKNLEGQGLLEHVHTIIAESSVVARSWTGGPIRLLFLDGDHRYQGVKVDVDLWAPHVAVGGIIVFDDAIDCYPGVLQIIRETLTGSHCWRPLTRIGKMECLCRIA